MMTQQSHPWAGPIHRYFCSGWAVLLPYLGAYLAYAALGLNPSSGFFSLLHVYWLLHAGHVAVAVFLVLERRKDRTTDAGGREALIPWALLALLFLLPGLYLEYPADPWEHLRRINEWSACAEVRQHSHWFKTGYFLPYSIFGWMASSRLALPAASAYVASVSLLLSWQYYRLARAVGLDASAAFAFVLIEALLAGNNVFSFLRYYGLSTTLYAQIAAVAIVRIAVERRGRLPGDLRTWAALAGLAFLAAFNHVQGLAIAAAGVIAVCGHAWWMNRRTAFLIALGLVAAASLAALWWWPRSPALAAAWDAGWLTRWGGFAVLPNGSASAQRIGAILGWVGMLNLACGVVLLLRSHVAGWLTVLPFGVLSVPLFAIPFSDFATRGGGGNIVVFPRLLFAIPAGLAIVALAQVIADSRWRRFLLPAAACLLLGALVVPAGSPGYNRFWHALARTPADLAMQQPYESFQAVRPIAGPGGLVATMSRLSFVLETVRPVPTVYTPYHYRGYYNGGNTTSQDFEFLDRVLANPGRRSESVVIVASPFLVSSPHSQAGVLSGHWLPQETALAYAGMDELAHALSPKGRSISFAPGEISYVRGSHDERQR